VSTRTRGSKGSKGSRGRARLGIRYFDDYVLLTDTHAWAYYRIPAVSYEFTTPEEREALATNITVAMAAIRMPDAEVHLRIAHRSYPAHAWATGLDATSDGGPGWRDYLEQTYQHVWSKDFWAKEIYLGVRLGQRGVRAQLSGGVLSQFRGVYARGEHGMGLDDDAVGTPEIAKWTESAERLGRALNASALAARHATSGEVAWLFRHTLMATADEPLPSATKRRRWGSGEIDMLFEGQIHNGRTLLCLEHMSGESYAAFISFARFPDVMSFPDGEPWLHFSDSLPFPVEISSRMKLIPPAKASKDVSRRLAHARDMDAHIREAGAEAPIALAEQIAAARMLEHGITKERLPFVYGWHRLIVTAPTRELCVRRVEAVVEHYRDIGIDVVNSTGDQFSLLCESLPGERIRLNSYVQRQPLYTIAGGMPTATVELGDQVDAGAGWIGPYIGETLGRARSIVHFDPLLAAARNRPTAIAITGEPGGGKTTLAMLLIYQLALRGATVAVIDPKGDAESLVEYLRQQGRKARVLPLGGAAPGVF
jgi:AAA-like domain